MPGDSTYNSDDKFIITSLSHHIAIKEQLIGQLNLLENNIYSLAEITDNSSLPAILCQDDETELECFLKDFGMEDLAAKVKAKRIALNLQT